MVGVKRAKVDKSPLVRYLNQDEQERLLNALHKRDEEKKAARESANYWRDQRGYEQKDDMRQHRFADYLNPMIVLAMNLGLRRGELFYLKWQDVKLDQKILTVHGANAKSGNTRHIPINATALDVLLSWKEQSQSTQLVFPGKDNKPMNNIKRSWQGLVKRAELTEFRFHDLRHHFASMLVMKGVDLNTVRELLGHANIETTLRYAHLAPEHKAAAVAVLDEPKEINTNLASVS